MIALPVLHRAAFPGVCPPLKFQKVFPETENRNSGNRKPLKLIHGFTSSKSTGKQFLELYMGIATTMW